MLIFSPGEEKTARVTVRNPTATAFDYEGRLYMDTQQKAEASFHLETDEQKDVLFPVTMPAAAGTYSVTLAVLVEGEVIATYKTAEDIQIVAPKPTFAITNLTVAPTEVHPGDPLEIVATIKNVGDVAGTCKIGDGPDVDFLVKTTPPLPLHYVIPLVTGPNTIIYPGPTRPLPEALTNIGPDGLNVLNIVWHQVNGEWISFFFYNGYPMGDLRELEQGKTYIVTVTEDCIWEIKDAAWGEISLEPGESQAVSFLVRPVELGTYTAEVNGLTKQFECVELPKGDLDDDGKLTRSDMDILAQYIAGYPISEISPLSEKEFLQRADINNDGVIDVRDLSALANMIEFDPWAYDTNKDGVISKAETLVALQDYFSEFITKEQVTEVLQLYYDGVKAALVLRFFAVTTPAAGRGVFEIHCHIKNSEDYEVRAQFNLVGTRAGKEIDETVDFTLKPGEIYDYVYRDSTYEGDYVQAKVVSEWGGTPTLEFEAGYFRYGVNLVATEIGADYVVLRYTRDEICDTWDFGLETEDQTINFPDLKIAGGWPTIYHLVTGLLPGRTYKAWCTGRNGGSMTGRTEFTT